MSSRSNSRKSALQMLFSYEFELTSVVKEFLEILCPYLHETGFVVPNVDIPHSHRATSLDVILNQIESKVLQDLQYYYLIQSHTTISSGNSTVSSKKGSGKYLQGWLQLKKPSYEEIISFVQVQIQQHSQNWFPSMSLYFWNARLKSLLEKPNLNILSKGQRSIYIGLCEQDVQEHFALIIAQSDILIEDFEKLSEYCHAPRLLAYWICTNQHSLLEDLRSHAQSYEKIGTYLQKVAEGQLQLSQLKQYLNGLLQYLERNKDISRLEITGNYTAREEMSPVLELEDDVDWGSPIPTLEEIQYSEKLILGVLKNWVDIDTKINLSSSAWSMNRMTHIDRSILRIGVFELLYCSNEVPARVVIDESLRLSHSFAEQGHNPKHAVGGRNWTKNQAEKRKPQKENTSPDSINPRRHSHKRKDTNKSSRFINGILDRIAKDHQLLQ
jgi:transcription antitermination protein NusB